MYSLEEHLTFTEETLEKWKECVTYLRENQRDPGGIRERQAHFFKGDLHGSMFVLQDWAEQSGRTDILKRLLVLDVELETF